MKNCPTCLRSFDQMTQYPFIELQKVEIPKDGIFGVDNGWDNPSDPIQVWKELSQKQEVLNYLKSLQSKVGLVIKPTELLPSWKADGYFEFAYPIFRTDAENVDGFHWGRFRCYFFAFRDDIDQEKIDGVCHLAVLENGPNFGSGGGPTLKIIGVIATLHYIPLLSNLVAF